MTKLNQRYLSKKGLALLLAALLLGLVTGLFLKGGESGKGVKPDGPSSAIEISSALGPLVYVCPMNCVPPMDKGGKCPICGMDLVASHLGPETEDGDPAKLKLTPEAIKLASIQLAPVERKFVMAEVKLFGKIDYDPAHMSYITAFMPGVIDRVYVKRAGQFVRWGDPLFDIYSADLLETQQQLDEAMKFVPSFYAFQRGRPHVAKDARVQPMKRPGEAGKESPEEEAALQTIDAIRHKLRIMGMPKRDIDEMMKVGEPTGIATVYAPMYGQVVDQKAFEGTYVNTGSAIFTLADPQHVWAKLDAYEADYPWIRKGQEVTFETEVYPGETFRGKVVYVDPVFDPKTRTFNIGVIYPDRGGRLKAGMLVRALIHARLRADGKLARPDDKGDSVPLVIPASAPLVTGKRSIVYVAVEGEEGVFKGREVTLGPKAKDHYVVLEGLMEGEQVVVNGNFKIDSAVQILARPGMMDMKDGDSAIEYHRPGGSEVMDSDYRSERSASRLESLRTGQEQEPVFRTDTQSIEDRRDRRRRESISRRKPGTYGDTTRPLSQRRIQ
ncbi:MAG: efflux RND transporter periplasmic adaptor subunit [Desulfobacterales bacterium]|jgi:Cu(I)/Ag(I) efflux system membrane fusion protein|nr:efflux RND transporter periplasmic adaptor subunit [Desulfobacterales bacterium]MBL7101178.1 efflux RND transporter periplasmic adaptor subunit [Desulfobacteraceae bacterium]MBL7171728.1 efflux RND transporter periplasmic adaptor subunit [Desulfobacteraceae bacterium]